MAITADSAPPTRPRSRAYEFIRGLYRRLIAPNSGSETTSEASLRPYARRLHQALAVFRFFFFAMGVGLSFFAEASRPQPLTLGGAIGLVGLYNVGRVWWPPDPVRRSVIIESAFLLVDVILAVFVVLLTGGLDSPFLIYSLAPALTAGLFMGPASAALAAGVSALAISGAHEASRFGLGGYSGLLDSNYLAFALLYSSVCILVAGLPFLANLNWQRRSRTTAAEAERFRLRREVHDDVAQTLAFLSLKLQIAESKTGSAGLTAQDVRGIREVVRRSYMAVRDYLDGTVDMTFVRPLRVGLAQAIHRWNQDTGLQGELNVVGAEPEIGPDVKRHLIQIAREALANAGKHANPQRVRVKLECRPDGILLLINDDGRGFEATASGGHGLEIMRQRAANIDASLSVTSSSGEGTEVRVDYQLPERQAPQ
ncbi:MAG: hypothetical protein HY678_09625 [Chloroflexi bacterium]|nr:hypothetical protein [Chloroflexota bacterium]